MDLGLHYFQTNPYAQFMARQNPSLLWPLKKKQCDQGPTLVTKATFPAQRQGTIWTQTLDKENWPTRLE